MRVRSGTEEGQDLVEYALVLPLFLLLVLGVVEFGILFFQYGTVANAAREAARAGIVPATTICDEACVDQQVTQAAHRLATGLDSDDMTIVVSHPAQDIVRVEVSYRTGFISRMIMEAVGGSTAITLRSVATMHREI